LITAESALLKLAFRVMCTPAERPLNGSFCLRSAAAANIDITRRSTTESAYNKKEQKGKKTHNFAKEVVKDVKKVI